MWQLKVKIWFGSSLCSCGVCLIVSELERKDFSKIFVTNIKTMIKWIFIHIFRKIHKYYSLFNTYFYLFINKTVYKHFSNMLLLKSMMQGICELNIR